MTMATLRRDRRSKSKRPTRLSSFHCVCCRRRARNISSSAIFHSASINMNLDGVARDDSGRPHNIITMRSARRRTAIDTMLLVWLTTSPLTAEATSFRTEDALPRSRDAMEAWSNNNSNEMNVRFSSSSENDRIGSKEATSPCEVDRPREQTFWRQVVGFAKMTRFTLLLEFASYSLGVMIRNTKADQHRWCLAGSVNSTSCIRAKVGATLASLGLVLMAALRVFVQASVILTRWTTEHGDVPTNSPILGTLLAFFGFLLPIILPLACRRFVSRRTDGTNKAGDLSTVNDTDGCLSCETCMLEHRNYFLPDKTATTTLPSHIMFRNDDGSMSSLSHAAADVPAKQNFGNTKLYFAHLFIHGYFVSTAAISRYPCDDGMLLVLVCAIAVCHGVHLELQITANTNFDDECAGSWPAIGFRLQNMFFRSFLTLGGLVALVVVRGSASLHNLVIGGTFAVAGGFYINLALIAIIAHAKHRKSRQYCESTTPTNSSHPFRRQKTTFEDDALGTPCIPCPKECPMSLPVRALSKAQRIPTQAPLQPGSAKGKSGLTDKYDYATWKMYARIVSAREERAKCALCMGSMDEDDEMAIVTMGKEAGKKKESNIEENTLTKDREERRLVEICPVPLHLELDEQREVATETSGFMRVHQECYYGATGGPACAHRKNMALTEENLVFQLEM